MLFRIATIIFFINYSFCLSTNFNINKINYFSPQIDKNYGNIFDYKVNLNQTNFNETVIISLVDTLNFINDSISVNVEVINNFSNDSNLYISKNEFVFANNPRYTITGELPYAKSHLKLVNTLALGAIYSGIFYAQHSIQQSDVWKEKGDFHIMEDIQYALWVDKFGHFYGGYATSYLFTEAFITAGFGWELSNILGSVMGLSYMSYIEILDGYSKGFGFSPSDYYADVAGSLFFLAQYYVPFLQNFNPKFMYVNPKWIGELDRNPHESFIDNYSAQTFWLSINFNNILKKKITYVPDWLELSIGYAAYSICFPPLGNCDPSKSTPLTQDAWGNRKIIIALDYDLVKLLPDGPPFWNWIKQGLKLFKLPSPAIEFGNRTKMFMLYPFFKLN